MHEEGDVDLNIDEILEDIGMCESDDDIHPNHFLYIFYIIIFFCYMLINSFLKFKKR